MKLLITNKFLNQKRTFTTRGFSLIELLVVLSIVSMLLTFGGQNYVRYIKNSKLLQAQSDLLMFASRLEQYKLFNLGYLGAAGSQISPENTGKPWIFQTYSPTNKSEQERLFNLSIFYVSDSGLDYQIVATPASQENTNIPEALQYGALIYYSDGRRGYDKNKDGEFANSELCWNC